MSDPDPEPEPIRIEVEDPPPPPPSLTNGIDQLPPKSEEMSRGFVPVLQLQRPKLQTIDSLEEDNGEIESILQQGAHKYAEEGDVNGLKNILQSGVNPNVKDKGGRTPLHYAVSIGCRCSKCLSNAEACVEILLDTQLMEINCQDADGNTALHLAIENQLSKCAEILISAGADVNIASAKGAAVYLLLQKLPDTMTYLLDECLLAEHDPKDEKCVLKVDFSPLVGNPKFRTIDGKPASSFSSSSCGPRSDLKISWQPEMKLLLFILQNPGTIAWRKSILTHPVIQIFMEQEWKRVRKFFLGAILLYVFYVMLYTYYILTIYLFKCPTAHFLVNESFIDPEELQSGNSRKEWLSFAKVNESELNDTDVDTGVLGLIDVRLFHPNSSTCQEVTGVGSEVILILVLTGLLIFVDISKLVITPRLYIRSFLNLGSWIYISLVLFSTIPNLAERKSIGIMQYQAAVMSIFLSWAFILQQLSRFPKLGKYIEMFGVVLHSFCFFILTFLSLFIAFALSFAMLFPTRLAFVKFLPSILKTFVMMTGEVDYNTLFYANTERVPGLLLGNFFFAAFVFIVTVVFMNVVIGLTVQDVQKLQAEGELRRVSRLILEMHRMECFIFSKRIPRLLGDKLKATISVLQPNKQGRREGLIFEFRPNCRKDRSVSKPVKEQALELASSSYEKFKTNECSKYSSNGDANGHLSPHPVILRRLNRQHYKLIATKSSIYRKGGKKITA